MATTDGTPGPAELTPVPPPPGRLDKAAGDELLTAHQRLFRVNVRRGGGPHAPEPPPRRVCTGIGAAYEVLADFVARLDPRLTVIRFDIPGIGGSPAPRLPFRIPGLARAVMAMVAELGYEQVDVLGYSWGGGLAQQIALQHPQRCRRLILVSTSTGSLSIPSHPRIARHVLTLHRLRQPGHAIRVAGEVYGGNAKLPTSRVQDLLRLQWATTTIRGYGYQLVAAAGWTSLHYLPRIKQQTLVLSGDDDPVIPTANARLLATLIPHATLHLFPGGHIEIAAAPELLLPWIHDFLDLPGAEDTRPAH